MNVIIRASTIGMAVHDNYHNRGIGSELLAAAINLAENWLNVSRLELTVFVDNRAAIHLYEKHGFVKEGRLRRYAFKNGQIFTDFSLIFQHESVRSVLICVPN